MGYVVLAGRTVPASAPGAAQDRDSSRLGGRRVGSGGLGGDVISEVVSVYALRAFVLALQPVSSGCIVDAPGLIGHKGDR